VRRGDWRIPQPRRLTEVLHRLLEPGWSPAPRCTCCCSPSSSQAARAAAPVPA